MTIPFIVIVFVHIRFQSIILYEWIISVHYFWKDLVKSPFCWIYLPHIFVYCPFLVGSVHAPMFCTRVYLCFVYFVNILLDLSRFFGILQNFLVLLVNVSWQDLITDMVLIESLCDLVHMCTAIKLCNTIRRIWPLSMALL